PQAVCECDIEFCWKALQAPSNRRRAHIRPRERPFRYCDQNVISLCTDMVLSCRVCSYLTFHEVHLSIAASARHPLLCNGICVLETFSDRASAVQTRAFA